MDQGEGYIPLFKHAERASDICEPLCSTVVIDAEVQAAAKQLMLSNTGASLLSASAASSVSCIHSTGEWVLFILLFRNQTYLEVEPPLGGPRQAPVS